MSHRRSLGGCRRSTPEESYRLERWIHRTGHPKAARYYIAAIAPMVQNARLEFGRDPRVRAGRLRIRAVESKVPPKSKVSRICL
jgi:hypothetical protein